MWALDGVGMEVNFCWGLCRAWLPSLLWFSQSRLVAFCLTDTWLSGPGLGSLAVSCLGLGRRQDSLGDRFMTNVRRERPKERHCSSAQRPNPSQQRRKITIDKRRWKGNSGVSMSRAIPAAHSLVFCPECERAGGGGASQFAEMRLAAQHPVVVSCMPCHITKQWPNCRIREGPAPAPEERVLRASKVLYVLGTAGLRFKVILL